MADRHPADDDDVGRAAREGLAGGLREHLPGAVGIVTKGAPLCAIGAFTHFVLGISVPVSTLATGFAGIGVGSSTWLRDG